MSHNPVVSVLMPAYNCEEFVKESISSILNQTFTGFELIVINDGSTDNTAKIIESFNDPRIHFINRDKNIGLDATLNSAFELCKGEYIARMDADDISLPTRLEKQVNFLNTHPEYGLVGTLYAHTDKNRKIVQYGAQLIDHDEIYLGINFVNSFCHGSVMFRKSVIDQFNLRYNPKYSPYEDYELWTRMVHHTKVANIPEVLYLYLDNPSGMFLSRHTEMLQGAANLSKSLESKLELPKIDRTYIKNLLNRSKMYRNTSINLMLAYQTYLYKLGRAYLRRHNRKGALLLIISFILNPSNWFKKILHVY